MDNTTINKIAAEIDKTGKELLANPKYQADLDEMSGFEGAEDMFYTLLLKIAGMKDKGEPS